MSLLESAPSFISESGKIGGRACHVTKRERVSLFKSPGEKSRQLVLKSNDLR